MQHILCPVDGSEHAQRAVAVAAEMASGMKTKLSLLFVREYVVGRGGSFEMSSPEEAAKYLEEAKRIAKDASYPEPSVTNVRARDAAHAILEFAEKNSVDHIVMGAAGKSGLKRFLIGSASSDVLRKSYCPVTIVH